MWVQEVKPTEFTMDSCCLRIAARTFGMETLLRGPIVLQVILQAKPVNASNDCKIILTRLPYLCPIYDGLPPGVNAMPINPSTEHGVFEPEATAAMGEAFDAACEELHCTSSSIP
jgi:hypothetical protein